MQGSWKIMFCATGLYQYIAWILVATEVNYTFNDKEIHGAPVIKFTMTRQFTMTLKNNNLQ